MIPLSVPKLAGNEWKYIKECLDTNWVSSVGSFVTRFEKSIADYTGAKFAIATSNGTSALHLSLLLSGVKKNDLVIIPDLTFIASANAVKYCGADPLLVDVDENNWQMDLNLLEIFLRKETVLKKKNCVHKKSKRIIRAIMPVHVHGNMCDMDKLIKLAKEFYLPIVEDSTEALGSSYKSKHSGTFGKFGCFSFNGNKIITTGGGGMIITNDEKLARKAKHLSTQAKSDPFEYVHDEVGYNYRLVNILAAMGVAQMEQLPIFLNRKKEVAKMYDKELLGIKGIKLHTSLKSVEENYWLYTVRVPKHKELMKYLGAQKIEVRPLWRPMSKLKMFAGSIKVTNERVSEKLYNSCVSLPCSSSITNQEVQEIISHIKRFYS